jgi:hypothetical protein
MTTVFVGRGSVFFGFRVTAVIVMMSRLTVMVGGKFVMRRRRVMMFARRMLGFRHVSLLS